MLLSVVFSTCSTITRKKKDSKNLIDFSSLDLLFGAASNYFILRQPLCVNKTEPSIIGLIGIISNQNT